MSSILTKTGIVILAAGRSSRLGQSKQLLPFRGETLLKRAIHTAIQSEVAEIVVVLGANADAHQKEITNERVDVVKNWDWEKGIGTSIACGVEKLTELLPHATACIILLCDQPYISAELIKKMQKIHSSSAKGIVACKYASTIGTPALFDKKYFKHIKLLKEDQGAKKLFSRFEDDLSTIDFPEGETDIDTQQDYIQLLNTN